MRMLRYAVDDIKSCVNEKGDKDGNYNQTIICIFGKQRRTSG